jgi:hypothetical protein
MEEKKGVIKIMEVKEMEEPQLVIGLIPALNRLFVDASWNIIRPHVENMAKASMGDYTAHEVWGAVYFGNAWLYMAYLETKPVKDGQAYIAVKMGSSPEEAKNDFVGYFILRPDAKGAFIWQAYIDPLQEGSNIMAKGIEFIVSEAQKIGTPRLTFSTLRQGWGRVAPKMGFRETFTTYTMELKKE